MFLWTIRVKKINIQYFFLLDAPFLAGQTDNNISVNIYHIWISMRNRQAMINIYFIWYLGRFIDLLIFNQSNPLYMTLISYEHKLIIKDGFVFCDKQPKQQWLSIVAIFYYWCCIHCIQLSFANFSCFCKKIRCSNRVVIRFGQSL